MKSFLIVVLFYMNGQPMIIDGWYPYEVPSRERCDAGVENIQNYITNVIGLPEGADRVSVMCKEVISGQLI